MSCCQSPHSLKFPFWQRQKPITIKHASTSSPFCRLPPNGSLALHPITGKLLLLTFVNSSNGGWTTTPCSWRCEKSFMRNPGTRGSRNWYTASRPPCAIGGVGWPRTSFFTSICSSSFSLSGLDSRRTRTNVGSGSSATSPFTSVWTAPRYGPTLSCFSLTLTLEPLLPLRGCRQMPSAKQGNCGAIPCIVGGTSRDNQ